MLDAKMNPVLRRLDKLEAKPESYAWGADTPLDDYDFPNLRSPHEQQVEATRQLEKMAQDPQNVAAWEEADRLADIKEQYNNSKEGRNEAAEYTKRARIDAEENVKYWVELDQEREQLGNGLANPILIPDSQESHITWATTTALAVTPLTTNPAPAPAGNRPMPPQQINSFPVVRKGSLSYANTAGKTKPQQNQTRTQTPGSTQAFNGTPLMEALLTDPKTTKPVIINNAKVVFGYSFPARLNKAALIEAYRNLTNNQ
jgi:hypothetical protein